MDVIYEKIYNKLQSVSNKDNCREAVYYKGIHYTFGDLIERINYIKKELECHRLEQNSIVVIYMERSFDMIVAMFSVIASGCAFLLLDINNNKKRNAYIMQVVKAKYILVLEKGKTVIIKREEICNSYRDIGYIVFTSGSTGRPKGVMIGIDSLYHMLYSIPRSLGIDRSDVILAASSVQFDVFILETFISLFNGCRIVLAAEPEYNNPRSLFALIEQQGVSLIQIVPSKIRMFLNYDYNLSALNSVKKIMIGGEKLTAGLVQQLKETTNAAIYHLYGLTEDSIWTCICDLSCTDNIYLGNPIEGHVIRLLNDNMDSGSQSDLRAIYISGIGLGRGYITENGFETLKCITDVEGSRLFCTGDYARLTKHNQMIFAGRKDNQMKIQGNRIEPEEIEAAVMGMEGIYDVVVSAYENENKDMILCLFYRSMPEITDKLIREVLLEQLPQSMVPHLYFKVENFDYLPSGKINRKSEKLYQIFQRRTRKDNFDCSNKVIEYLAELLTVNKSYISREKSFDELEITSILFIKLILFVENEFSISVDDDKLVVLDYESIDEFIRYVNKKVMEKKDNRI